MGLPIVCQLPKFKCALCTGPSFHRKSHLGPKFPFSQQTICFGHIIITQISLTQLRLFGIRSCIIFIRISLPVQRICFWWNNAYSYSYKVDRQQKLRKYLFVCCWRGEEDHQRDPYPCAWWCGRLWYVEVDRQWIDSVSLPYPRPGPEASGRTGMGGA